MKPLPGLDLLLTGGEVFLPGHGLSRVDVGIRDGVVVALLDPGTTVDATESLDVTERWVLPGAIDPHVHLGKDIRVPREPEDAEMETASAVCGGVTTMLVYLMDAAPYGESFEVAQASMTGNSHCHYGFHFVLGTREQLEELPQYVSELGVSSFKFFMNFRGDEGAYLGLPGNDDGFLFELLEQSVRHGAMVNPHPENVELLWRLRDQPRDESVPPLRAWNDSRPDYVEAQALQSASYLASVTGASLYGVHTSSRAALAAVAPIQEEYPDVFLETCPHYLTLSTESEAGTLGKVNPPLRPPCNADALWEAIANGRVHCVGSDHNSRHRSFKEKDIWSASAGFPGVGTLLPVVLSEGLARGIPLETLVAVTSTNAARLFGMYPRKGAIQVGADADLVVIRPNSTTTITAASQHSAAGYTPWEGVTVDLEVEHTIVAGRFAVRNGELSSERAGTYVPRPRSGASTLRPPAMSASGPLDESSKENE